MLKKMIKYEDYNGETREEAFFFSLNRAELLRMNMTKRGGFERYLQNLIDEKDPEKLTVMFESFILNSYGVKSEDGTRFMKTPEIVEDFKSSAAYAQLFLEMATDLDKFTEFIMGIVPADLAAEIKSSGGLDKAKKAANIQALPQSE